MYMAYSSKPWHLSSVLAYNRQRKDGYGYSKFGSCNQNVLILRTWTTMGEAQVQQVHTEHLSQNGRNSGPLDK